MLKQRAWWTGGALVIEQRGGPLAIKRTLRLGEDGGTLRVMVEVTQGEAAHTTDLVYRGAG